MSEWRGGGAGGAIVVRRQGIGAHTLKWGEGGGLRVANWDTYA